MAIASAPTVASAVIASGTAAPTVAAGATVAALLALDGVQMRMVNSAIMTPLAGDKALRALAAEAHMLSERWVADTGAMPGEVASRALSPQLRQKREQLDLAVLGRVREVLEGQLSVHERRLEHGITPQATRRVVSTEGLPMAPWPLKDSEHAGLVELGERLTKYIQTVATVRNAPGLPAELPQFKARLAELEVVEDRLRQQLQTVQQKLRDEGVDWSGGSLAARELQPPVAGVDWDQALDLRSRIPLAWSGYAE